MDHNSHSLKVLKVMQDLYHQQSKPQTLNPTLNPKP